MRSDGTVGTLSGDVTWAQNMILAEINRVWSIEFVHSWPSPLAFLLGFPLVQWVPQQGDRPWLWEETALVDHSEDRILVL